MKHVKPIHLIGVLVILLSCFFLFQCSDGQNNNPTTDNTNETKQSAGTFENETQLENYLKEQFAKSILPQSYYADDNSTLEDGGTAPAAGNTENSVTGGDADRSKSEDSYSNTNNQENGVDESDKTKTDGTYIYIAGTKDISIIDVSNPEAMQKVFSADIKGNVSALHLYQDVLAVLYTPYMETIYRDKTAAETDATEDLAVSSACPYWIPVNVQTGVRLYDISDPTHPTLINDTVIDGNLVSTRMIGGKLHVVQRFLPNLPPLDYYYDGTVKGQSSAISKNATVLNNLTLDEMLPKYEMTDKDDAKNDTGRLVKPEDFYRPQTEAGGSMVTISTFDLNNPTQAMKSVGIVANADIVYASQKALYVLASQWGYYLANDAFEETSNQVKTEIQKFDLTGNDVVSVGSGTIVGTVLNQFSLGEYEDVLRVAATTGNTWRRARETQSSAVYCLKSNADSDGLEIIGKIENIAEGENLYSARFIGPRGYLVTFVQVDPLFTLDLSDPTNPTIVGELKVPGYSSYIHPISDDLLLTIGKDTEEKEGRVLEKGIQLSIFDISNFADPKLLHKEVIGDRGTYSEALYDHKAFNFRPTQSLLAIPIELYKIQSTPDDTWEYGTYDSSGLYVYQIDETNGFDYMGRIVTATASSDSYYYPYGYWTRSIFINQHVFTVKENVIYSAQTDNIENTINRLVIKEYEKNDVPPYPEGAVPEGAINDDGIVTEKN